MARQTRRTRQDADTVAGYEIVDLTAGDVVPMLKELETDATSGMFSLVGVSVHKNGKPIGVEGARKLKLSEFMQLARAVMERSGLGDIGGAISGKD